MEQLTPFDYLVEGTPRGYKNDADFPLCDNHDGRAGWEAKYNYVSVNIDVAPCKNYVSGEETNQVLTQVCELYHEWIGKETKWAADGINEHGLAVSMLAFVQRRFTSHKYEPEKIDEGYTYLCYMDFVAYALGMFKNIAEIETALNDDKFIMLDTKLEDKFKMLGETTHWSLQDATGRNVVLEYNVHNPGKATFYENTAGVLTNNPDFQWHMTNLNNYIGLSNHEGGINQEDPSWKDTFNVVDKSHTNPHSATGFDEIGNKLGVGTNFMGIPGDFSPPSRFVRLFYMKQLATKQITPTIEAGPNDAVTFAQKIVGTVLIPRGTMPIETADLVSSTQWTVVKVPKERKFYWKGYTDSRLKMIDLAKMDTDDFAKDKSYVIEDFETHVIDMTTEFSDMKKDAVDHHHRAESYLQDAVKLNLHRLLDKMTQA